MKIFLTGISGLLGLNIALQTRNNFDIVGCFNNHPVQLEGIDQIRLDLTSIKNIAEAVHSIKPDVIINTAALTNVDECETNPNLAQVLNVELPSQLARISAAKKIKLVHISTDQLFDGSTSWSDESDVPSPLNNYGLTKLNAERAVLEINPSSLIIRTNFFGWGTSIRSSFSDWILNNLQERKKLSMFTDVHFTPIQINQLIDLIIMLFETESYGIFHLTGSERLSKYQFGLQIADSFGFSADQITPISVEEFEFKAKRPKDMSLDCRKAEITLDTKMPSVTVGLQRLVDLKRSGWDVALNRAVL